MAHKGIREFEPQELSSIALGQQGFHILDGTGGIKTHECGVATGGGVVGYPDNQYWVAIKAIESDAVIEARTLQGQGFTKDVSKVYTGDVANDGLTIGNGDIVYGVFDKVQIASGKFVIAYIGK